LHFASSTGWLTKDFQAETIARYRAYPQNDHAGSTAGDTQLLMAH
jgi:hypothetical protein